MTRAAVILSFVFALLTAGTPGAAYFSSAATSSKERGPLVPLELPEEEFEEESSGEAEFYAPGLVCAYFDVSLPASPWHTLRRDLDDPFVREPLRHGPNVSRAPPRGNCFV